MSVRVVVDVPSESDEQLRKREESMTESSLPIFAYASSPMGEQVAKSENCDLVRVTPDGATR